MRSTPGPACSAKPGYSARVTVQAGADRESEEAQRDRGVGMARIAVVTPCFNDGEFVGDAIASIREAEPVEVVVVDDGSTDEATKEVLAELARSGIARVVRRENGGLAAARMTGVAATTAPYVFPLDADDIVEPGSLAALADRLDADPNVAFAYGNGTYLREGIDWRARPWDPFVLLYLNGWGASCLVRRDALMAVGGWSLRGCYEDWDFLLALAESGYQGAPVDHLVLHYRRHHGPRENKRCLRQHARAYRTLRRRHPALYARRAELAARSPLPWRTRFMMPLRHGSRPFFPFWLYWWVRGRRSLRPRS